MPPSQRPLARGRAAGAAIFDEEMHAAWMAGDERATNVCVARVLGVDERVVRDYRDGKKTLPYGALKVLPSWLASRLLTRMQAELGLGDRMAASMLSRGIEALSASLTRSNVDEVRRTVRDIQRRLLELDARIDEVSR